MSLLPLRDPACDYIDKHERIPVPDSQLQLQCLVPEAVVKIRVARQLAKLQQQLVHANAERERLEAAPLQSELDAAIHALHEYNECKDMAQSLLGKLAEVRGTTTSALYDEFGLDIQDRG